MPVIDARRVLTAESEGTFKSFLKKWRLYKSRKSVQSLSCMSLDNMRVALEHARKGKVSTNPPSGIQARESTTSQQAVEV